MAPQFLDIHLEGMDDNGEKLRRIIDEGVPVAVSVCPETFRRGGYYSRKYPYLPKFVDLITEIVSREGSILGQQGNKHKCAHRHVWADKWHENHCLWGKSLDKDDQRDFMEIGRDTLVELFGKKPELYAPPNHQFDANSILAAQEMGYVFFAERALGIAEPYILDGLIMLPESKLVNLGNVKYMHYDEINDNSATFENCLASAGRFDELNPSITFRHSQNMHLTWVMKRAKDIKNFPKKLLARAASGLNDALMH